VSTGGLSRARLDRMHDVMAGHVDRGELPGVVTLVSRRGVVHVDSIGTTACGGRDPMRRDTIFRITSMTKPAEDMIGILMTQRLSYPGASSVYADFWTSAYAAIDD
jgi:Beta-lactamase